MKTLNKVLTLGLLLAGIYTPVQGQITFSMSAYDNSNKLADGVTNVGNETILKVGYFYNGGFTSATALQTAWGSLTGSMASRLGVFDDTFVSLKADNGIALETTAGEFDPGMGQFWISLDPNGRGNESATRFASTLSVGTSNQTLNGISLINVKPFVWVETADRSQFGLYESTRAMPSGSFPDLSLDLVMGSGTFTAIVGTLNTISFNLSAIPEPNTSVLLGLGLLSFLIKKRRNNLSI
jgi:hypothetical protein